MHMQGPLTYLSRAEYMHSHYVVFGFGSLDKYSNNKAGGSQAPILGKSVAEQQVRHGG